jgi:hypothetical protein
MRDTDEHGAYGTIVVVGGGCYGSYYVQQLHRAAAADALAATRIVVVDRDAACAVAAALGEADSPPPPVPTHLVVSDWRVFFNEYLDSAAARPGEARDDAIVPSPLMPHLMAEWLVARARARWPDRGVATAPLARAPTTPWERAGADGTRYVSFATWICPINCIEPRICPHTKSERTWSLAPWVREHAGGLVDASVPGDASRSAPVAAVLHCTHRAYGVGMFDTRDVIAADAAIALAGDRSAADAVIGTVSHCHGALTRLVVPAPAPSAGSHAR